MTIEEFIKDYYKQRFGDKWDRVAKQFDYYDMTDFADSYHLAKSKEEARDNENYPTWIGSDGKALFPKSAKELRDDKETLNKFHKKFLECESIPEDIAEIVNKNFWDLLY